MIKKRVTNTLYGAILFGLFVAGFLLIQYCTPIGLGLTNDSASYLNGARNLLAGDGYTRTSGKSEIKPITHFPPGYSLTIAAISRVGLETQRAARFENLLLFAINLLLSAWVLWWMTRSKWISILGALLVLSSQVMVYVHIFLLSEPLYLVVSSLALLSTAIYLEKRNWFYLAMAGVLTCFSYLTRYVGVAVYGTILVTLFVLLPGWKQKVRSMIVFLLFSLPGTIYWSLRNMALSQNPTNRQWVFHPISSDEALNGMNNFWSWFMPNRFMPRNPQTMGWVIGLAAIGGLVLIGVVLAWRRFNISTHDRAYDRQPALFVFGLYTIAYTVLILLSMTFFDSSTKFEFRIMVPALLSGSLFLLGWVGQWIARQSLGIKIPVVVLILGLMILHGLDLRGAISTYHEEGQGFLALNWRISKSLQYIEKLPEDQIIYSNRAPVIYLLTGRTAYVLPTRLDPVTQQVRPDYPSDLANLRKDVQAGADIIIFYPKDLLSSAENRDWIAELTQGMIPIEELSDGIVYSAR